MSHTNPFIYGIHPVTEMLKHQPEQISKIFVKKGGNPRAFGEIFREASANRIPVVEVHGSKLEELAGVRKTQGVVAAISEIAYEDFEEWLERVEPTPDLAVLLLDEIEDPHNFGAILRTAAAAGMGAVIVPKHRQAPVSAVVFKTSAGTAGRIPIVRAGNVNQAILQLKERGFWIAGLEQRASQRLWDCVFDVPMAFVIGNEGRGMRQKTGGHCDFLLSLPMDNGVESLNASVSAALVCYEWRRQKSGTGDK